VLAGLPTGGREVLRRLEHALVLGGVAFDPPLLVVAVLTTAGLVGADRLDVAVREGADPDVLPGRGDDQRHAPFLVGPGEAFAVQAEVDEVLGRVGVDALARPAGLAGRDGAQADHGSGLPGFQPRTRERRAPPC